MLEEVEAQYGTREFVGVHARVEGDWEQQCRAAQNRTDPSTMLFDNKHQCWVCCLMGPPPTQIHGSFRRACSLLGPSWDICMGPAAAHAALSLRQKPIWDRAPFTHQQQDPQLARPLHSDLSMGDRAKHTSLRLWKRCAILEAAGSFTAVSKPGTSLSMP